jgi:radical SAM superfamily enzyme YgiQ (UPF0313 family)
MVAAYAVNNFSSSIEVEIFKSVDEFLRHVDKKPPQIACFSNYIWNSNLCYQVASRIKKKYPKTIIVFGGPNYPLDVWEQEEFLKNHQDIDFNIVKEGEKAFVQLLNVLFKYDFDIEKIKKKRIQIGSCHYLNDGEFIRGELLPPISNLDDIPSPYLSGLCDKLLSQNLLPLVQYVRGCPFACTFCQDGDDYYNGVRRFSIDRIKEELSYLAKKSKAQTLYCGDLNFGMYKEDLEICREIALVQKKHGWPKHFDGISGKNKKERILEASSIIGQTYISAAVQSADEQVLKNVRRSNISTKKMFELVQEVKKSESTAFSELILGLPGDTKESHIKSNVELIDAEVDLIRSHQLVMLPAAEVSSKEQRKKYGLITRFRVTPKTVVPYRMFGEEFFAPEIDEICVASKTLSFEDYLECRLFNLTVEIFYNSRIFKDLLRLLKIRGVMASSFIMGIHQRVRSSERLSELYDDFLGETKELWKSRRELIALLENKEVIGKFVSMEMGNNEQLIYRAIAILDMMKELHEIAFGLAKDMLDLKMKLKEKETDFLKEFEAFNLITTGDMLSGGKPKRKSFHYDFIRLIKSEFRKNYVEVYVPEGIEFEFSYTDKQKDLIADKFMIYGKSKNSEAYILGTALQNHKAFREVNYSPLSE